MEPLGSLQAVLDTLARFNTAPDGSPSEGMGTLTLYGPGLVVHVPTATEAITQVLVSVTEEELAWPVLSRLCRAARWAMMDAETGRTFTG